MMVGKFGFKIGLELGMWIQKKMIAGAALDPNEKVGSQGYGKGHFTSSKKDFTYIIYFENLANATAAAQEINITDNIGDYFNRSTFKTIELTIGNMTIPLPDNSTDIDFSIDMRPKQNLTIVVNISFNRILGCWFVILKG